MEVVSKAAAVKSGICTTYAVFPALPFFNVDMTNHSPAKEYVRLFLTRLPARPPEAKVRANRNNFGLGY